MRSRGEGYSSLLGKVTLVVELIVERICFLDARWRVDEEELAVDIVLQDKSRSSRLIRLTQTLCAEASGSGIGTKKLRSRGNARAAFFQRPRLDLDAVDGFQEALWDSLRHKSDGARELSHLVDWQNAVADQVGLCKRKVGEDETRAIAEDDVVAQMNGLKVLRLARSRRDGHLLGANQGINAEEDVFQFLNGENLCILVFVTNFPATVILALLLGRRVLLRCWLLAGPPRERRLRLLVRLAVPVPRLVQLLGELCREEPILGTEEQRVSRIDNLHYKV
ncbi:hypothetical protein TOPH_01828 [Tolypocladium ophioglossoides CBS 100239]|uniref:Uncharacterized protein n=1 Tax=Tolypocladium ophioglossoides (strain CBS 100239) TaxID=1163406 RepID=A0A0L0NHY6_TOLOC|nr:hypothetical protein TOPH_01828 [Tolypocladium ophioglossoides CBS 100239]